ncbi:MAG: glycosyltransferase family 4 protein [Legionellaceae bacterium]|nr:glycosyltransferase family 4 protein [Legionellaceae bacterium]
MKIALCSSFVPFISGGYRNIVEWLQMMLEEQGHQVEKIYLPQVDAPSTLFQQMMAYRWVNVDSADRIICFRPQAHLIPHPHKILWFIHHLRLFYDLWDSPYRGFPDDAQHRGIRDALHTVDNAALREAKTIFTNSKEVSHRLKTYNHIDSEVLYPPVFQPERFFTARHNNSIVYICRLEHHKRQHLLIDAMQYTRTPVHLHLSGVDSDGYADTLIQKITELNLSEQVTIENRWISEEEKVQQFAHCLAAAYLPVNEDSYGYPSIEASHAGKAILTTADSGGVLELVQDGINGYITEPSPQALAEAMDKLYIDRVTTKKMGENARQRLSELNISWSHVLQRILA